MKSNWQVVNYKLGLVREHCLSVVNNGSVVGFL